MSRHSETAYLDGLRGFAAVLVYWHHHELKAHASSTDIFERAFGYQGQYHFVALPWIRNVFNGGHYATTTFFVISGYVLSVRPLDIIASDDPTTRQGELANYLSSAFFRRWLRLYIPLICTTFIYMTSWHVFGLRIPGAQPQDSWRKEVKNWFGEVMDFSFMFSRIGHPWFSYNDHLWSIPIEFKGSIVNYITLLALSRSSRKARICCQLLLIGYFMLGVRDGCHCAFFVAGMLLRELDLWFEMEMYLQSSFSRLKPLTKYWPVLTLLLSMYLGGVPHCLDVPCLRKNPGWYILSFLFPPMDFAYDPKWFYLLPAASLLVVAVRAIPWLKRFFESPPCQYLGRISYGLYLVHGPIYQIFADTLYAAVAWEDRGGPVVHASLEGLINKLTMSNRGPLGLEFAFLVPQLILLPLTFGAAEIVTRVFDKPSNKFSHWLYQQTVTTVDNDRYKQV